MADVAAAAAAATAAADAAAAAFGDADGFGIDMGVLSLILRQPSCPGKQTMARNQWQLKIKFKVRCLFRHCALPTLMAITYFSLMGIIMKSLLNRLTFLVHVLTRACLLSAADNLGSSFGDQEVRRL